MAGFDTRRSRTILAVALGAIAWGSFAIADDEPAWRMEWKELTNQFLSTISADSPREDILRAGRLAAVGIDDQRPLSQEMAQRGREAVLAIPNHADFFQQEMEEIRGKWRSGKITTPFDSKRQQIIKSLSALPSPQVVGLLGELLYDLDCTDSPDAAIPMANAYLAQDALTRLLEDPPAVGRRAHELIRNRRTWQLWYEQVKAGTRTFRFKGDPQPYTLAGPAEKELRPAETAPRQRRLPPPSELPPGDLDDKSVSDGFPWFPLGLAGAVLIVATVFVFRTKRRMR